MPSSDLSARFTCNSCGQSFGVQSRTGDEHGNLPWLVVVDGDDVTDYDEVLARVSCQECLPTPYSGSEKDSLMAKLAVIAPEGVVPAKVSSVPGRAPVGISMAMMPGNVSRASGFTMAGISCAPPPKDAPPGVGVVVVAPKESAMPSPAFAAAVFAGTQRRSDVGIVMIGQTAPPPSSQVGVMAISMPLIPAPPRHSTPRRRSGRYDPGGSATIGDAVCASLDVVEARRSQTLRGRMDADQARADAGQLANQLGVSHPLGDRAREADEAALREKQERFDERLPVLAGLIKRLKRTSNDRLAGKIAVRLAEIDSQLCRVHATDPEERSHRAILELAGATQVWLQNRFRDRLIYECEDAEVTEMSEDVLSAFLLMELDPEILSIRKLHRVFSSAEEGGGGNSEGDLEFRLQCTEGEDVATVTLSPAEHARVCRELLREEVGSTATIVDGQVAKPRKHVEFIHIKPLASNCVRACVKRADKEAALEPLPTIPEGASVGLSSEPSVSGDQIVLSEGVRELLACHESIRFLHELLTSKDHVESDMALYLECLTALKEAIEVYFERRFQWETADESQQTEVAPKALEPEADLHV
ncbi:hypothetical protein HOI18_01625 [Candidatus Uhrbacteria bacterium]|jgi:hypothetical protein|nr:hypothetical protein [Candidatus Uhrbacteria bacterium]